MKKRITISIALFFAIGPALSLYAADNSPPEASAYGSQMLAPMACGNTTVIDVWTLNTPEGPPFHGHE